MPVVHAAPGPPRPDPIADAEAGAHLADRALWEAVAQLVSARARLHEARCPEGPDCRGCQARRLAQRDVAATLRRMTEHIDRALGRLDVLSSDAPR